MSSRFVSGGIIAGDGDSSSSDARGATTNTTASTTTPTTSTTAAGTGTRTGNGTGTGTGTGGSGSNHGGVMSASSKEWEAVQKDLEEERRRRAEARKRDVEGGGEKSLYEILQANKGELLIYLPTDRTYIVNRSLTCSLFVSLRTCLISFIGLILHFLLLLDFLSYFFFLPLLNLLHSRQTSRLRRTEPYPEPVPRPRRRRDRVPARRQR